MFSKYSNCRVARSAVGGTVIVIIYILFLQVQPIRNQEVMDTTPASELRRLRGDLLKHYDKTMRPVKNASVPTDVLLFFNVKHIVALEEKYQALTVKGELMMQWTDDHLTWDVSSYSGISSVRFRPQDIWIPDIYSVYNLKPTNMYDTYQGSPVLVYGNGSVKWYPEEVFDVPCNARYLHYPFDSHNCSILLAAWTHKGDQVTLNTIDIPSSPATSATGTEWALTMVTHSALDPRLYHNSHVIDIRLFLERTSRIYRYICVVPTLTTLFSSIFGFWLLPNDSSRYMIGCSNVILMSLMLQNLAATVPAGNDIPLIAQYSAAFLCMSGVFLMVTVVTNLLRECSGRPPQVLLRLAHQHLDQYLCLNLFSQFSNGDKVLGDMSGTSSDGVSTMSPEEEKRKKDWMYTSILVDRISFWVFVLTYAVLITALSSV